MEMEFFQRIVELVTRLETRRLARNQEYLDGVIVLTWFWAVIHDRPVSWACQKRHWPAHCRRQKRPSNTTMSRRKKSPGVKALLEQIERHVLRPAGMNLVWMVDGKPLMIGGCSKDRQAGYGRAAGGKAKGYKLHAVFGPGFRVAAWRIAPMDVDERVMARRTFRTFSEQGYVLADSNYDSNKLHATCDDHEELQLVCPRRYGASRGMGHRNQTKGRLRSRDLTEGPSDFGRELLQQRFEIEQRFGHLTRWGGGLTCLPAWARTHYRVHRWGQAKLILTALKLQCV